jgi:hypothetical protein
MFSRAVGLHEEATGIAVVGFDRDDPEFLFEEHGMATTCKYFELMGDDVELNAELGSGQGRPDIGQRVASDHWPTKYHALQPAFSLESAENVNTILTTLKSEVGVGGGVFLVRTGHRLQRRKAMIRVWHAAQAQPERSLDDLIGESQPLETHSAGSDATHHYLFTPLVLLASPLVRGFTASRVISEAMETYTLVFIQDAGRSAPFDRDAVSWRHVLHDGLPSLRDIRLADQRWLIGLNAPAAEIPSVPLVTWWIAKLNELLTEATDLGRYRGVDALLDARNAYRELRTLDRIIANCVRIQAAPNDHTARVSAAFEFFDLLPNLLPARLKAKRIWASLANPRHASEILREAFSKSPEPIRSVLTERAVHVTDTLREETLQTVVPGRLGRRGVRVGGGALMQPDSYVAAILQQLRNTHHGYELEEQSQRDVLDTHTGHISMALPELVVLYVLAMGADAANALDGRWVR